ncbi:MAG: FtsH protease activity modulator HflK [Lachnospiraceae bacterium]|nr:FtsH protease activity modulator HflK [Lachnospiraceae bacterium]MBP3611532.1 FtsH protease activity modulator HflK [Lachnospiraceae bacterium]
MNQNDAKTVLRVVKIVALILAVLILGMNSYYTIGEQEQAVVTTFGKPESVSTPGLHFKVPFIQKVTKVDTTIKGLAIGYDINSNMPVEEESLMITSDYNFVNVDFFLEYKVSDPIKALYASQNPVLILKNMAQGCIRSVIGSYEVDSVITTGKSEIQSRIKEELMAQLEMQDIGIQLVSISIQDAEPPTEAVIEAFKAVETAKQGKETAINNANKYRSEQKPQADAQVDQIKKEAEAQKEARINEAEGQAARFNALYEEYIKYPLITKQRMFYEAMQEILPGLEVIIDNGDGSVQKILPLDTFGE